MAVMRGRALATQGSALGSSLHVGKKHAEATEQQHGTGRQWKPRHQGCKNASQYNDRKDRQRKRAIVNEQPGQLAQDSD